MAKRIRLNHIARVSLRGQRVRGLHLGTKARLPRGLSGVPFKSYRTTSKKRPIALFGGKRLKRNLIPAWRKAHGAI